MLTLSPEQEERARRLHNKAVVVDGHCDSLQPVLRGERELGVRSNLGHLDLPRMFEGGITAQIFACRPHIDGVPTKTPLETYLAQASTLCREIHSNSDKFTLALQAADIQAAKRRGRIAAILGMEDAAPLGGDLAVLEMLRKLGLRNIGLVWGPQNEIGEGVSGQHRRGRGLTRLGIDLIKEANRLGVIVDVAHLNERGFWDVLSATDKPIINSHANTRALYNHPRNMSDEQLKALAACVGVIHVMFTFLHSDPEKSTIETVLDHIDHIVGLVGPQHVGIGSDFDGLGAKPPPTGLEDATKMFNITRGLVLRGYADADILNILGGNFLRVFTAVAG